MVFLLYTNYKLTLIYLGCTLAPLSVAAGMFTVITSLTKQLTDQQGAQGARAVELISGAKTVFSFGMQEAAKADYESAVFKSQALGVKLKIFEAVNMGVIFGGFFGVLSMALWVGGKMAIDGDIDKAFLVSYVNLCFMMVNLCSRRLRVIRSPHGCFHLRLGYRP
jgi:ABC-type bacteriocin/lantibiotic exporter with double-glycine peptidase domain